MTTYRTKLADIHRSWHVIDAEGEVLGRLASRVAQLLKGKHNPLYSPHLDTGDHVVVINAAKIRLTGGKLTGKFYYRHSQYPGGLRVTALQKVLDDHPTRVIEHAVKGMLPHNSLGRQMYRKLRVYAGAKHPHEAQAAAGRGLLPQDLVAATPVQVPAPASPTEQPQASSPASGRRGRRQATTE